MSRARRGDEPPHLLLLFEDSSWRRLWPLTAVRPVWSLRVGARCLWEKQLDAFRPGRWTVDVGGSHVSDARSAVIEAFAESTAIPAVPAARPSDTVLWWNGAALPPTSRLASLPARARGIRYLDRHRRVAGIRHRVRDTSPDAARDLLSPDAPLPPGWEESSSAVEWTSELWDLVRLLPGELLRDLDRRSSGRASAGRATGARVLGTRVRIVSGARVDPGAVLDSRPGPIVIERGATIEPMTLVVGPAFVGAGTQLLGGKLATVSLGPQCRVGGEVEHAVFQAHGNKRHQGFLGHAAVGEWVNLGAMTTNSDLKNNYGSVRVWVEGQEIDSGESKVGCFLGDHVKTGIGTLLTTGAVVGPGSNLFAGGRYTPRYLPGWSWWDGERLLTHDWDKFLATARTAMARRDRALGPRYESALRAAWSQGPRAH